MRNYIDKINTHHGEAKREDVVKAHNFYAENQRKNPHTPEFYEEFKDPTEEDIDLFCKDNLFPTVV